MHIYFAKYLISSTVIFDKFFSLPKYQLVKLIKTALCDWMIDFEIINWNVTSEILDYFSNETNSL